MRLRQFVCWVMIAMTATTAALAQRKETEAVKEPLRNLGAEHPFRKVVAQALAESRKMAGCKGVLIVFNKWGEEGGPTGNSPLERAMRAAGMNEAHVTTAAAMNASPAKEALSQYVVVKIDVFKDTTGVVPDAYKQNEFYGNTYPTFLRYDLSGKLVERHTANDWQEKNPNNRAAEIGEKLAEWYR